LTRSLDSRLNGRMGPKIRFRQSDANHPDVALLEHLLVGRQELADIRELQYLAQLGGGYSPCRVYVMQPVCQRTTRNVLIFKLGPRSEIEEEAIRKTVVASHVGPENTVHLIEKFLDDDNGVLIFDYAGYSGKPPQDLLSVLARPEATQAVESTVRIIEQWASECDWRRDNVAHQISQWMASKLGQLPEAIQATEDFRSLYSPDFGEAYANPYYYLQHQTKSLDLVCPFAFTHGDLNFRNVLFNVAPGSVPDVATPLIIDFRHAGVEQYAIVDLAKLEAGIRYEHSPRFDGIEGLQQVVTLLASSRTALELGHAPESLTDKRLQELWRCMATIRRATSALFKSHPESRPCYWLTLASYAMSVATYQKLPEPARHLAFLDAAALFTRYFVEREPTAPQRLLPIHRTLSPPVLDVKGPLEEYRNLPILMTSLREGNSIFVVGPGYGKTSGVEPLLAFLQRVYKDVVGEPSAIASRTVLLEALARRVPRQRIAQAIRERVASWGPDKDASELALVKPAAVLNVHYHARTLSLARQVSLSGEVCRIDTTEDAVFHMDEIAAGVTPYLAINGDCESKPDDLVLTSGDRRHRTQCIQIVADALARRNRLLALVFWKCEELPVDELLDIRDQLGSTSALNIETFYLTDQDDEQRDATLDAVAVWRVRRTLREIASVCGTTDSSDAAQAAISWRTEDSIYSLPDISRLSRGLVFPYDELGNVSGQMIMTEPSEYLIGNPPTQVDIDDGRVVRRPVVEQELMPAVRDAISSRESRIRPVLVSGRAGAGVSSVLCLAANALARDASAPVFVVARSATRGNMEWSNVVGILAEISKETKRPCILIIDASAGSANDIEVIARVADDRPLDLVLLIGGRTELVDDLVDRSGMSEFRRVIVSDALDQRECAALARILRHNGYAQLKSQSELEQQLGKTRFLLAAIYEATDRSNRKFSEIILHEYRRYDSDQLVQRAYRIICTMSWLGEPVSQFWLLKALGDYGRNDAMRILSRLSDDVVVEYPRKIVGELGDGEPWISARHRIIAEEVLRVAVPEPQHRLLDVESLIASANMASQSEGAIVAGILMHKGPLAKWIRESFQDSPAEQCRRLEGLYRHAISGPMNPQTEIHVRQHFALAMRSFDRHDDALEQAQCALALDRSNPASLHILGLVHERRALYSWRRFVQSQGEATDALVAAERHEVEALEFFASVRDQVPTDEHGYESEVRYYVRKQGVLLSLSTDKVAAPLKRASDQLFTGLWLTKRAEANVTASRLTVLPETKARLLSAIGEFKQALQLLQEQLRDAKDPVRVVQIQRGLVATYLQCDMHEDAVRTITSLVDGGEHDASLFLMRDDALCSLRRALAEREALLRPSAEEWNRREVQTLLRWAEICLYKSDWNEASRVLRRADDAAQIRMSTFQRDEVKGFLKSDPYGANARRLEGVVSRMAHSSEGIVTFSGCSRGIQFFLDRDRGKIHIGDHVTFGVVWRLRGLRAVGLELSGRTRSQ
jgi:hypothetical protein